MLEKKTLIDNLHVPSQVINPETNPLVEHPQLKTRRTLQSDIETVAKICAESSFSFNVLLPGLMDTPNAPEL